MSHPEQSVAAFQHSSATLEGQQKKFEVSPAKSARSSLLRAFLILHSGFLSFLSFSIVLPTPTLTWDVDSGGRTARPHPKMFFCSLSLHLFLQTKPISCLWGSALHHFVVHSINLVEGEVGGRDHLLGTTRDKKTLLLIFFKYCLLLLWNCNIAKKQREQYNKSLYPHHSASIIIHICFASRPAPPQP